MSSFLGQINTFTPRIPRPKQSPFRQINEELTDFVHRTFNNLITSNGNSSSFSFVLAVVGLRLRSEHEDDCCVTIELVAPSTPQQAEAATAASKEAVGRGGKESTHEEEATAAAAAEEEAMRVSRESYVALRAALRERFLEEAKGGVSKGARPDRLRFGVVPRNFKGAVQTKDLAAAWEAAGGCDDLEYRDEQGPLETS